MTTADRRSGSAAVSTAERIGGSLQQRRSRVRDNATAVMYADAVRMADAFLSAADHTGDRELIRAARDGVSLAMDRAWTVGRLTQTEIASLRGIDQSSVSDAISSLRRKRSAAQLRESIGGNA